MPLLPLIFAIIQLIPTLINILKMIMDLFHKAPANNPVRVEAESELHTILTRQHGLRHREDRQQAKDFRKELEAFHERTKEKFAAHGVQV